MATLKAYITWEIIDSNGNEIASSYEHISNLDDAQCWAGSMEMRLDKAEKLEQSDDTDTK